MFAFWRPKNKLPIWRELYRNLLVTEVYLSVHISTSVAWWVGKLEAAVFCSYQESLLKPASFSHQSLIFVVVRTSWVASMLQLLYTYSGRLACKYIFVETTTQFSFFDDLARSMTFSNVLSSLIALHVSSGRVVCSSQLLLYTCWYRWWCRRLRLIEYVAGTTRNNQWSDDEQGVLRLIQIGCCLFILTRCLASVLQADRRVIWGAHALVLGPFQV